MAADDRSDFNTLEEGRRPKLDIPLSRGEKWLRAASAAGVLVCVVLTAYGMLDLILLAVSVLAFVVIEVLSGYPRYYRYLTPVTEENAEFQYSSARRLLAWLRAEIVGFILVVAGLLYIVKMGLPDYPVFLVIIVLFVLTGIVFHGTALAYFIRLSSYRSKNDKRR